jgi:pimeloyl-ACP methyl ester carboxylesterase
MGYETVASADGTAIAYETFGQGPPLIAVCGATCDRALMRSTAQAIGEHFATVNYDRRGRGDSGDTLPYAIDREMEDIAALIDEVGGAAHLYGHSSGAGLVLRAVAAGLPVEKFVVHDPPYSPDDTSSRDAARG